MKYYLDSGYIDMKYFINRKYPFIFLVHGRGTGKTYGALKELTYSNTKFMYMRRTATQNDMVSTPELSPFKPLMDDDEQLHVLPQTIAKNVYGMYHAELGEDGLFKPAGNPFCLCTALSVVSNLRGFSQEDCKYLIFDEFIPQAEERPFKAEGEALLNAYETINRNRELKGKLPLHLIGLSNANKLNAPVFQSLGILDAVDRMVRKGKECFIDDTRGIAVYKLRDSPISGKKAQTALYRATQNTRFSEMALSNDFSKDHFSYIKSVPLQEYKPIATLGDICLYRHKSKREYYFSRHTSGTPKHYDYTDDISKKRIKKELYLMLEALITGNVYFEDYYCKTVLGEALK